jgi:hypothetical protein
VAKKQKAAAKKGKTKSAKKAAKARAAPLPPYKCQTTLVAGTCLRFNLNPKTKQYDLPPGGIPMDCKDCKWFFD